MTDAPRSFAPNAVHMIRTVQMIHIQLSAMADQKASILMAASFVVFTITINQAHGALPPLPLLILGGFAFVSAMLTIFAILPKTTLPEGAPLNLLFFGSYTSLSHDEFVTQVVDAMADEETMLRTIASDVYGNGVVLQTKKFRYLALAYRTFLTGLILSGGTFALRALL